MRYVLLFILLGTLAGQTGGKGLICAAAFIAWAWWADREGVWKVLHAVWEAKEWVKWKLAGGR